MAAGPASHPRFARAWARAAPRAVPAGERAALVAGLRGRVVEVGAGSGVGLAHYAAGCEVVAVEPEPSLRALAERAGTAAAAQVEVRDGVAEALPVADGWADAVVCCLVLCSVADQAAALAEARRVLRPGGELRLREHVVARAAPARALQRALDRSGLWPALAGGCHLARDTPAALAAAGFELEASRRWVVGACGVGLPHVEGVARAV